jgi:NADH dehydrogenase [ubiquinone] 1 alpha subcomplex assembly factor 1
MGYAAMRSRSQPIYELLKRRLPLAEFDNLSFKVRGDGRTYIVNIQVTSLFPEDLFQCFLYTKKAVDDSNDWQEISLKFEDFLLTYRGLLQKDQILLPNHQIQTIGVLLADKRNGPFRLELDSIQGKT